MKLDRFDTPSHVVADLFREVRNHLGGQSGIVLDPAVGSGALLEPFIEAGTGWSLAAVDIDTEAVESLAARWSACRSMCGDFLQLSPMEVSEQIGGRFDAVVLNPPFSERGAQLTEVRVGGELVRCSRSLSFVLVASQYVACSGVLAAVLPVSALRAQKNEAALDYLNLAGHLSVGARYSRRAFSNAVTSTCLVTWTPRHGGSTSLQTASLSRHSHSRPIEVIRGWVPMHSRARRKGPWRPLVHTTDLRTVHRGFDQLRLCRSVRSLGGPAVLLPRVGRLAAEQIVPLRAGDGDVCLSDCVLAVPVESDSAADRLAGRLRASVGSLSHLYEATGAPYVTIAELSNWLNRASSGPGGTERRLHDACIDGVVGTSSFCSPLLRELQIASMTSVGGSRVRGSM